MLPARSSSPGRHGSYNSVRLQELHPETALGWEETPEPRMRRLLKCFQAHWLGVAPPALHPAFPAGVRKLPGKSPFACPAHPHTPPGGEALLNRLFHKLARGGKTQQSKRDWESRTTQNACPSTNTPEYLKCI